MFVIMLMFETWEWIKKIFHVSDISALQPTGGSIASFLRQANMR